MKSGPGRKKPGGRVGDWGETFALLAHFYPSLDPGQLDSEQIRHYIDRIPMLLKLTGPL